MTGAGAELDRAAEPSANEPNAGSAPGQTHDEASAGQRAAVGALLGRGLTLADVARLLVTTPNSVADWRDGPRPAPGRVRKRLIELSAMADEALGEALAKSVSGYGRGRLTAVEEAERVASLGAAGLWPLHVCAGRIVELSERARERGLSSTDLIEFLGVSRRTFYQYRAATNTRPPPVEVASRLRLLGEYLEAGGQSQPAALRLLTLEGRLDRASIILFGALHYKGFEPGDPRKEYALRVLAGMTGFNARTLRRYLPARDRRRGVNRAVVAAFEGVARKLGAIV
jgi:hypothetical protein